jgi:hypothetical protein
MSKEYRYVLFEVPLSEIELLNRRFQVILSEIKEPLVIEKEVQEEITLKTAENNGFSLVSTWRMFKSSFGGQDKERYEPILVFKKD